MSINASPLTFPPHFTWGFAAAAPQIEGAAFTDGKSESVWDHFARKEGSILNGDNLDIACDHYHRYKDDFALMAELGVKNYRLSLSWSRIVPTGRDVINEKGIEFYHRLIDAIQEHGIQPWVTMFHWDMPQALEDDFGGWRDRRTSDAFGFYADTIVKSYGEKVKHWITLNEILCFTRCGYGEGGKAPGLRLSEKIVNQTYHTALLAHGHGVRAVREHGGEGAQVGITDNCEICIPLSETEPDILAAKQHFKKTNTRVLDPILTGQYNPEFLKEAGPDAPDFQAEDLKHISRPIDFFGMNVYYGYYVRADQNGKPEALPFPKSFPSADAQWLKHAPQAIYWGPRLVHELYNVDSIYITENGAGYDDAPPVHGEVLDLHRRDYIRNYLKELHRGIQDGVPVHGYFLWSFMDNFEWEDGYQRRFGVVYNDYKEQKRTPKASARWYTKVVTSNSIV